MGRELCEIDGRLKRRLQTYGGDSSVVVAIVGISSGVMSHLALKNACNLKVSLVVFTKNVNQNVFI